MDLVLYDEEMRAIQSVIEQLHIDARSRIVSVVDKNGQQIACAGEVQGIDSTSLASLVAGNVAATDGLAKLIGEQEFSFVYHEGEKDYVHMAIVANRVILVVIFDERSSLGLVRLRVKKSGQELSKIFERMLEKSKNQPHGGLEAAFAEITDDDIDNLFG